MSANKVGFLGSGRIARILLGGWKHSGRMPADIAVYDPDAAAMAHLRDQFPDIRIVPDPASLLDQARWLMVAVHPPQLGLALATIQGKLAPETVVVSLAPKMKLAKLSELLGGWNRIVRMLPNAPSIIGVGYNPVAFGPELSTRDREEFLALMQPLGASPQVPEDHLEAYAILTAMGPTYLWFQFDTLRRLGEEFGLPPAELQSGLEAMVIGAAKSFFSSGIEPSVVMDLIPVKPMGDQESAISDAYRSHLTAMFSKLKG